MPIPGQTITILDPGLNLVEPGPSAPMVLGVAEAGSVAADVITSVNSPNAVRDAFGSQGPLSQALAAILREGGGPAFGVRLNATTAGANSAVVPTYVSTATGTITLGGAPHDSYDVEIEILSDGSVASADFSFRYSLDNPTANNPGTVRTFSEEIVVPAAGTFLIPDTNVTLTFVDGAGPIFFEDGDLHNFTTTEPLFAAPDIAAAIAVIDADPREFSFMELAGKIVDAATGATIFGAMDGHMTTFQSNFRYTRCLMHTGTDSVANIVSSFAAVSSRRVSACYQGIDIAAGIAIPGNATPNRGLQEAVGARAAASLISTDLGRVASGNITGAVGIDHDEFFNETLDAQRITTARTLLGRQGFYITNGRLKAPAGSDFQFWQFGRIMDVACRRVFIEQQLFLNAGLRTNADGTIDERDAQRLEARVTEALRIELTQPANAEGVPGHVSDLSYTIDRTNNLVSSQTLNSEVAIRPLGYSKFITTQIGFAVTV